MEIIVPGIVYLVGAGPGDPELLTLKALRLIKNCDALVHDALIPDEITKEAGKNTEIFHVGKRAGKCSVPQAETNDLILKLAKEGKNVVRLKGGDPFVFVDKEKKTVNWRDLAKSSDSLVIFMGIKNIEFIVEELILGGLDKSTKCAVIQEATLKNQKCLIEKLDNLPDKIKDKEFLAPSIIIIGKIVEFKVNNNITKVSDVYLPDINKVQLYNKSQK